MSDCRELARETLESLPVDPSRQLSLRGMLVAMAVVGAMLGGALRLQAPALFINIILASIAAMVWRVARPSGLGMICATLGLQAAVVAGVIYLRESVWAFVDALFYLFVATVLIVAALLIFTWAGHPTSTASRQNRVAMFVLICLVIGGAMLAPPVLTGYRQVWVDAQNRENAARLQATINEVDALCARLGDAPDTEDELVRLLGHPLATIQSDGKIRISYRRIGSAHYCLEFHDWGLFSYDSAKPDLGWVRVPF